MMRIFIISVLVVMFVQSGHESRAADQSVSKKELQRIKREMAQTKKGIRQADKKEHSILTDLDRLDRQIQSGKAELAAQQKWLLGTEDSLKELEGSTDKINAELAGLKQRYARRVRALYKMSRDGTGVEALTFCAQGDGIKRYTYLAMVAERDRRIMNEYATALDGLALKQKQIAEKKNALLERSRTIETQKKGLEAGKRKKALLLASVREEKGTYEQTLRELKESSASLWALIKKAEQERRDQNFASRASGQQLAAGTTRMPWPVEGQVLTRFGMQRHPVFKTMVFRAGIEIAAREGEPVRVVSDGQVVFADWYKGYGKLMIVEHAPGFYSLYGNLSRLDAAQGDRVSRGQVIGLAGDTGSLKGSKLYFEIRRNGEAQDPLTWLAKR